MIVTKTDKPRFSDLFPATFGFSARDPEDPSRLRELSEDTGGAGGWTTDPGRRERSISGSSSSSSGLWPGADAPRRAAAAAAPETLCTEDDDDAPLDIEKRVRSRRVSSDGCALSCSVIFPMSDEKKIQRKKERNSTITRARKQLNKTILNQSEA